MLNQWSTLLRKHDIKDSLIMEGFHSVRTVRCNQTEVCILWD